MDTDSAGDWRRGHETAREVRAALIDLGIPETEVTSITTRRDLADRDYVYLGSLPLDDVDKLLRALEVARAGRTP
jgi:hypothetical protein